MSFSCTVRWWQRSELILFRTILLDIKSARLPSGDFVLIAAMDLVGELCQRFVLATRVGKAACNSYGTVEQQSYLCGIYILV